MCVCVLVRVCVCVCVCVCLSVIVYGPIEMTEDCWTEIFYTQNLSIKDTLGLGYRVPYSGTSLMRTTCNQERVVPHRWIPA